MSGEKRKAGDGFNYVTGPEIADRYGVCSISRSADVATRINNNIDFNIMRGCKWSIID